MTYQQYQPYAAWMQSIEPITTIAETPKGYLFLLDLPGIKSDNVEMLFQGPCFTVRGKQESFGIESGIILLHSERMFGLFQRTLPLPIDADWENVEVKFENGVMEILFPKKDPEKTSYKSQGQENASYKKMNMGKTSGSSSKN